MGMKNKYKKLYIYIYMFLMLSFNNKNMISKILFLFLFALKTMSSEIPNNGQYLNQNTKLSNRFSFTELTYSKAKKVDNYLSKTHKIQKNDDKNNRILKKKSSIFGYKVYNSKTKNA